MSDRRSAAGVPSEKLFSATRYRISVRSTLVIIFLSLPLFPQHSHSKQGYFTTSCNTHLFFIARSSQHCPVQNHKIPRQEGEKKKRSRPPHPKEGFLLLVLPSSLLGIRVPSPFSLAGKIRFRSNFVWLARAKRGTFPTCHFISPIFFFSARSDGRTGDV